MSKAIVGATVGALEIAGGIVLGMTGVGAPLAMMLLTAGIATEASAIAGLIGSNNGMGVTTRQAAATRTIIRGEQRIGGTIVYCSTTGSSKRQYNIVIVLATHPCESIVNLYLDGRQVFWQHGSRGNVTMPDGSNFGGTADPGRFYGPNGVAYTFGSEVFCFTHMGHETAGTVDNTDLYNNDPAWAPTADGTPYGGGCTWVYLKLEADAATFPQFPEIRFTVKGKNDIWDPRTSSRGYTTNWALHIADAIADPLWGLGDNTVNQAQLIAAANVCDEQVQCQAPTLSGGIISHGGLNESRYALHWHYDTSISPGDAIVKMMDAAAGRLSRIAGEWYIWPAYYQGPSFTFDEGALLDAIQWTPKRSLQDLVNRVTGTYCAPNFPYNVAGDLYDGNGYWQGQTQNNFPYAFQDTNYPMYACDERHGYGAGVDVFLTEDGGIALPLEVEQPCVLSISQAQRVAKIKLLRNRQQGSGTFTMSLAAWQMQPTDVFYFNMPALSWINKMLEVASLTFKVAKRNNSEVPSVFVEIGVEETDPSVYEWSIAEELNAYDVPVAPGFGASTIVPPPTGLSVADDAATATTAIDGTQIPRLLAQWTPPADNLVNNGGHIEVQYQIYLPSPRTGWGVGSPMPEFMPVGGFGWSNWVDAGNCSGISTLCYINGIPATLQVNVQIRAVRSNGAASVWVTTGHAIGIRPRPIWQLGSGLGLALQYPDGTNIEVLQPAQVGADVTAQNALIMLQNPNFANSDAGWTPGTGWGASTCANYGVPSPGAGIAGCGVFDVGSSLTTSALTNAQQTPCNQGTVIDAYCSILGSAAATGSAQIRVNYFNASNVCITTIPGNAVPANSGWAQSRVLATAPAGTAYATIDVAVFSGTFIWIATGFHATQQPRSQDEIADGSTYLRMPRTIYGSSGNAIDLSGNIKLKNTKKQAGVTTNPTLASVYADLPELGSGNPAMTIGLNGNPVELGVNLAFTSITGSSGFVTGIGYTPPAFSVSNGSGPPTIAVAITGGGGTGATATIGWNQSGTYPNWTWTPTVNISPGSGYTSAPNCAVTVTNANGPYSNGTTNYTGSIGSGTPTPNVGAAIQVQIKMDGITVYGPFTLATDANGNATYMGSILITPAPSAASHSFQVQAMTNSGKTITSTIRAFQLVELG